MAGPAAEAKEHEKQAQKALSSSWMSLKFKPDEMLASMEYAQAATSYRAAGLLGDSIRTHVKSAELKEKTRDYFGAGRAYEQAAAICDGKPELGSAEAHWIPAVRCYRLSGKGEAAAKLILKLAALQEKNGNLAKAKEAYDEAIDIYEQEEKDYQIGDVYKQYIGCLVRSEMFEEALAAMDGHIKLLAKQGYHPFAHKEILAKCVLTLSMGDTVRAEDVLQNINDQVKDWFMSNEANAGFEMVAAFQAYDAEKVERLSKEQVFTFLQVEVARLARKLRVATLPTAPAAAAPAMAAPAKTAGYAADPAPVPTPDVATTPAPESTDPPQQPTAQDLGALLM
jgi:tetratricopeptide (TPR) repeat protein